MYLATFLVLCKKGDLVDTTVSPQRENREMNLYEVKKRNLPLFNGLYFYQTEL